MNTISLGHVVIAALVVQVCANVAVASDAALQRIDFTANVQSANVKGKGSFEGVLPKGVLENAAAWSAVKATSMIEKIDGADYLTINTVEGAGQFQVGLSPKIVFPGIYRIVMEMHATGNLDFNSLKVNFRGGEPNYHSYWNGKFEGDGKVTLYADVPKLRGDEPRSRIGMFIYTTVGKVHLKSLEIFPATEAEMYASIRRPDPSVREYFRIGRFADGLPSDWGLDRDINDYVAGRGDPAPDGAPTLKVAAGERFSLYSAPFQTNEPQQPHRVKFRYKSRGDFVASVLNGDQRYVFGSRKLEPSGEWKSAEVRFTPNFKSVAFVLRFEGVGELQLDDISVRALKHDALPAPYSAYLALAPVSGDVGGDSRIFFADEMPRLKVSAIGADPSAKVLVETEDLYGRRATRLVNLGIVDFPDMPLGQFAVRARLVAGVRALSESAEIVLTRVKRPVRWDRDAPDSQFGGHFNAVTSMIRRMKALGVNWARFHDAATECSGWWKIEPTPGEWKFPDEKIARYRDNHVKIYAQLGTAPKWATYFDRLGYKQEDYFTKYLRPTNTVAWLDYVKKYVSHYRDRIDSYFIWNEPWGRWWQSAKDVQFFGGKEKAAEQFGEFSVLTYKAAKEVFSSVDISGINGCSGNDKWSAGVMKGGGFEACDSLDYHIYSQEKRLVCPNERATSEKFLEPFRKAHPDLCGKPVIMSEGQGCSSGGFASEVSYRSGLYRDTVPWGGESPVRLARDADNQVRYVLSILSEDVKRVFLYTQHGYTALGVKPSFLALVGADGRTDPSGAAFAHAATLIEGRKFVKCEKFGSNGYVWYFRGEDDRAGTVGVYSGLTIDEVLSLKGEVTDLYGNRPTRETFFPSTLVYVESMSTPSSRQMCGALLGAIAAHAIEIKTPALTVGLSDPAPGKTPVVTSFVSAAGREYAAKKPAPELFRVQLRHVANLTNVVNCSARDAKLVSCESVDGGVDLVYRQFWHPIEKVVCSIRPDRVSGKVRWHIRVTPREGYAVSTVDYPVINFNCALGEDSADDRLTGGTRAKWGEVVDPARTMDPKKWHSVSGEQPGTLFAQFGCFYDPQGGVYAASEDPKCLDKKMNWVRIQDAVQMYWQMRTWSERTYDPTYDVVTTCFVGANGGEADWHDAADIYRAWARQQYWCRKTLLEKPNLPQWIKDAPAMVRWYRNWYACPGDIRDWLQKYWKAKFPKMPLLSAAWGWEKWDYWVTPDYFPMYPDDATFAKCVEAMRDADSHFFPWPSGYNWTLTHHKVGGMPIYDTHAAFAKVEHLMAKNADGSTFNVKPDWYFGGIMSTFCPGDPRSREYFVREVVSPLFDRGMEAIQLDQVNGGRSRSCWCREHGHAPGYGAWRTESIRAQLDLIEAEAARRGRTIVMGFEDPNEFYLDRVAVADYRDCELKAPNQIPASVWSYLYHEYAAPFQSNPSRDNRWMAAHCAVDGQIPFFIPSIDDADPSGSGISNGDFERVDLRAGNAVGWSYGHCQDRGGKFAVETQDVAEGRRAMCVSSTNHSDLAWLAQDTSVWGRMKVGEKYRITGKVKVIARPETLNLSFSVFTRGWTRQIAITRVNAKDFPSVGEGWKLVRGSVMTLPDKVGAGHICLQVRTGEVLLDDVRLERVDQSGNGAPLALEAGAYTKFMHDWVTLYHGAARDFLAYGRQIRTPKITCAKHRVVFANGASGPFEIERPAVESQAYESLDGRRRALILANASDGNQTVSWKADGVVHRRIVPVNSVICADL